MIFRCFLHLFFAILVVSVHARPVPPERAPTTPIPTTPIPSVPSQLRSNTAPASSPHNNYIDPAQSNVIIPPTDPGLQGAGSDIRLPPIPGSPHPEPPTGLRYGTLGLSHTDDHSIPIEARGSSGWSSVGAGSRQLPRLSLDTDTESPIDDDFGPLTTSPESMISAGAYHTQLRTPDTGSSRISYGRDEVQPSPPPLSPTQDDRSFYESGSARSTTPQPPARNPSGA